MAEVKGGGLGYIELANDSLGLGALGQGIGGAISSNAVEGCGRRPALFGRAKWNECVAKNQALKSQIITAQTTPTPPNNTLIIAIIAVVVVVVLVVVLKK